MCVLLHPHFRHRSDAKLYFGSGFSAVGSAHVWGARGRWFESSNPDQKKPKLLIFNNLGFFYAVNWRDFGVITIFNGLSAVIQYFGIMFSL